MPPAQKIYLFCSKPSFEVLPLTSYQRMLVHRSAKYYKLSQETDPHTKAIVVGLTQDSRMYVGPFTQIIHFSDIHIRR